MATYRIHSALRSKGADSRLLVQKKMTDDQSVIGPPNKLRNDLTVFRKYLEEASFKLYYRNREKRLFSPSWIPEKTASKVDELDPDIINLFWVNEAFLRIETLEKFNRPIVWTLHDMWPFTGGCHYDNGCGRFTASCGNCPLLNSQKERDLSRSVWSRKQKSWRNIPIVIVGTSRWIAETASASSLFQNNRVEVIPNAIDTGRYKPLNKEVARSAYNLTPGTPDKKLILFSAFNATSDKRKGHDFLVKALEKLSRDGWSDKAELVVIGASRPLDLPDLGMKAHYMGRLHDEISQILLYSAADVLVAPSRQENLANTVMESLACGTPVVAFDIGGMPDMIDHKLSGYLAIPFETDDLAEGIKWIIEKENRHLMLSEHARQTVKKRFSMKKVAAQYLALYKDILT